ncbi:MAG: PAS domain S-box protein [Planctomycetota bacterium]
MRPGVGISFRIALCVLITAGIILAASLFVPLWLATATVMVAAAIGYGSAVFLSPPSKSPSSSAVEATTNRTIADVFATTHDAILVHDPNTGILLDVNENMLEMFRCTREQAIGMTLSSFLPDVEPFGAERGLEMIRRAMTEGPQSFEWQAGRLDGDHFWAEVCLHGTVLDGQPCVIAAVADSTRHRLKDEAIRFLGEPASTMDSTAYFQSMALHLARVVNSDCVLIGESSEDINASIQTLAIAEENEIVDNTTYALEGTPCERVIGQIPVMIPKDVTTLYPDDEMLVDMAMEGYVGIPLFDEQQKPVGIVVALFRRPVRDTEFVESILQLFSSRIASEMTRARAVNALRAREADLRKAQSIAHLGSYAFNFQTGKLIWSDEMRSILGIPDAEPTLDRMVALIHPDDRERVLQESTAAREHGAPFDTEFRVVRDDGSIRHVHDVGEISRDADGNPMTMFGTTLDVTDRKAHEESIRASEIRYQLVFNQQFQFLAILSPDGRVLEINDLPLRSTGANREEFIGQLFWETPPWRDLDDWAETIRLHIVEAVERNEPVLAEDKYRAANGEVRYALSAWTAIQDDEGQVKYIAAQAMDITDRKRAEEELAAREELQRLLVSELDHRVRNNLSSLLTLIDLSRDSSDSVDELASSLSSRAQAIAAVHAILSDTQWHGGDLNTMIETITHASDDGRIAIHGPPVHVPLSQAQALGMIINEFMTNCQKHGALRSSDGTVDINWSAERIDDQTTKLILHWQESGGPPCSPDSPHGTGTTLIEGLAGSELQGHVTLTYPSAGASHTLHASLIEHATAQFGRPSVSTEAHS